MLYKVTDMFLLPSLRALNLLLVIETLRAGLPVFISIGDGNYPETLNELENGWVADDDGHGVLRSTFSHMVGQTKGERAAFGTRSEKLAEEQFSTDGCIENFVNEMVCIK